MKRRLQLTVIGNSVASASQANFGFEVGKLLGKLNVVTITGGRGGVMEAVAKGVAEQNGICVGILPSEHMSESNEFNTIVIPTGIGFARNSMNVLSADIVVAIGGGAGTLSEIAFAWTYKKPVFCYTGVEGWANNLAGKYIDEKLDQPLQGFASIEELEELIEAFIN